MDRQLVLFEDRIASLSPIDAPTSPVLTGTAQRAAVADDLRKGKIICKLAPTLPGDAANGFFAAPGNSRREERVVSFMEMEKRVSAFLFEVGKGIAEVIGVHPELLGDAGMREEVAVNDAKQTNRGSEVFGPLLKNPARFGA